MTSASAAALRSPLGVDGRLFVPLGDRAKSLGEALAERRLNALLLTSPESIYYVTGYPALPSAGNPILYALRTRLPAFAVVGSDGAVTLGCWGFSVEGVPMRADAVAAFNNFATATAALLETVLPLAGSEGRIGIEATCPFFAMSALGPQLEQRLVVADDVIDAFRLIKSPEEISHLTRSLEIAEAAVGALLDTLSPGDSRLAVMGRARDLLFEHGADGIGHMTLTFGETNPEIALDERLEPGRLAVLDLGAIVAGYRSDNRRYAYAGSPSADLLEQHQAMIGIVDEVGQSLVPGRPYREVHGLAIELFEERGIPLLARFSHAGHNIGLETEERWIDDTTDAVVQAGMVINIELYSLTPSGEQIGDEETYVVEAGGPRRISRLPTDLRLV